MKKRETTFPSLLIINEFYKHLYQEVRRYIEIDQLGVGLIKIYIVPNINDLKIKKNENKKYSLQCFFCVVYVFDTLTGTSRWQNTCNIFPHSIHFQLKWRSSLSFEADNLSTFIFFSYGIFARRNGLVRAGLGFLLCYVIWFRAIDCLIGFWKLRRIDNLFAQTYFLFFCVLKWTFLMVYIYDYFTFTNAIRVT